MGCPCRYLVDTCAADRISGTALELGAACGLPGMLLARRGLRVTLTDLPWLLPLTAINVQALVAARSLKR